MPKYEFEIVEEIIRTAVIEVAHDLPDGGPYDVDLLDLVDDIAIATRDGSRRVSVVRAADSARVDASFDLPSAREDLSR